ncbi:MAG: hypothetical protein Q9187_004096, partial [Circinaria calcarea]
AATVERVLDAANGSRVLEAEEEMPASLEETGERGGAEVCGREGEEDGVEEGEEGDGEGEGICGGESRVGGGEEGFGRGTADEEERGCEEEVV